MKNQKPTPADQEFKNGVERTAEEIAEAVTKLSLAAEALNNGRLKRKTILLLLSHASKVPQRDVEYVLDAMVNLKHTYLK